MKPFAAPVDDILYSLTHVARADTLPDWDGDLTRELADHFASFAEGEIAPIDEQGDQQGARLENGRVRMPDGFAETYAAYIEQGWPGLTAPETYGGQGLGAVMLGVTSEIFSGANHSLQMITGLVPGAIRVLMRFGSDDQKSRYIPALASGETLATMCLTEPVAGSDLARIGCRAIADGNAWQITGEKIFISGGDQDLSETIQHLVLARTSDDGLKGLFLFLCNAVRADGTRNAVTVTRIEEKMGLHASPTCQLAFDGAEAELIGAEGAGLAAMFTMMNHARLDVALQGVAHAARSLDVATAYAADRVQGKGPNGPAKLNEHADVARMLDQIAAIAIGGRAIAHLALVAMEQGDNPDLVEFLTPVAKVFCSDGGIKAAELGIQVLGGYGYLQEYRLDQTYRDARITAIYEGANGIHARMLATRLLNARPADAFAQLITAELPTDLTAPWIKTAEVMRAREDPTPEAHDFMQLTIETALQLVWTRVLATAESHPRPDWLRRIATRAASRGAKRLAYLASLVADT